MKPNMKEIRKWVILYAADRLRANATQQYEDQKISRSKAKRIAWSVAKTNQFHTVHRVLCLQDFGVPGTNQWATFGVKDEIARQIGVARNDWNTIHTFKDYAARNYRFVARDHDIHELVRRVDCKYIAISMVPGKIEVTRVKSDKEETK